MFDRAPLAHCGSSSRPGWSDAAEVRYRRFLELTGRLRILGAGSPGDHNTPV